MHIEEEEEEEEEEENRELIERFRKLKARYNLKENIQIAKTYNCTNRYIQAYKTLYGPKT